MAGTNDKSDRKAAKGSSFSKPCVLLIVIAGIERFAFKGVAANLVTYLTDVANMSNSAAAKTVNGWIGFTSIMPLLVAPLADAYWDSYATILITSFIYVLGLMALTLTTLVWSLMPGTKATSTAALFSSLYLISLGLGGYNPSLQAFGADQLEPEGDLPSCTAKDTSKPSQRTLFFQWWYFGVCTGSLLGVSILAYVEDTVGWSIGFGIPTVAMVLSIAFFSCGTRFYTYKEDDGNRSECKPVMSVIGLIRSAACRILRGGSDSDKERGPGELELEARPLCSKGLEGAKDSEARPRGDARMTDNVRVIIRLIPIWTMLLTFAVIFQQPATFFTKQGMTMRRDIGRGFKIPPATLQSAITVSIILLMPFYDKVLIPAARLVTRSRKGISVMQRMGIGMILSILAMVIAALVESKRLRISKLAGIAPSARRPGPLSIFWLLPQYVLLGISDIFTVVGMQEFFYSEVPVRMRTMGIALYTSVFGVGSFVSALLITLVETFTGTEGRPGGWFADDMREARLDNYYWLLSALSGVSLVVYVLLCKCYKSREALENEALGLTC
uniref:Uncharacterized protein n=1 Tax=Kalanchoe fedtschenkoi TaxID=63787 RepID=A0A7N0UZB1_KALFE